jgi:hypothetical protein
VDMGRSQLLTSVFGVVAVITFSTQMYGFETASSSFYSNSTYSGHEEITRQALNNIALKIKESDTSNDIFSLSDLSYDLQPEPKGLFGYKSRNMVIHGNFSSDFPGQTKVMSLSEFWKNPGFGGFENPDNQVNHFLRNYKNEYTLASAYETCVLARDKIKFIILKALEFWNAGDKTKSLFLIGHATHTLQDSFSTAHTVRAGEGENYNLKNVCYFGTKIAKQMTTREAKQELCYHGTPDSRDAIWNTNPQRYQEALKNWSSEKAIQCDKSMNYPTTEESKDACMSSEARLARAATEKFLFLVFNQLKPENLTRKSSESFLATLDSNLFDGPVGDHDLDKKMNNGILRCDGLSKTIVEGDPYISDIIGG